VIATKPARKPCPVTDQPHQPRPTLLRSVLERLTNQAIAQRLDVPERAVKSGLRQLFGKLGVRTRAQLIKIALEEYRNDLYA
jgi:two-component system nitrate/nitrite response regulator NarL